MPSATLCELENSLRLILLRLGFEGHYVLIAKYPWFGGIVAISACKKVEINCQVAIAGWKVEIV